jgi:ABC-type multidrug transport system permease subunit
MLLKELRLIAIDKFALLMVFALPGMIMGTLWVARIQASFSTLGTANGKNSGALTIGVVDLDPTDTYPGQDLSGNFTWYLQQSPDLFVIVFATEQDALNALYDDSISAYAVLPYGFEGNITGDIPAFVPIHISSTNFQKEATVFGAFETVVAQFRFDHGWAKGEIDVTTVREFKPAGDYSAASFGVFLIAFSSFIAVAATGAQAIVGDVPLNRMLLTPATKMEAILAKVIAYFVLGMVQAQFLLLLWMGLFGIVPNADYLTLNGVLALMSLSGSALGVFISTLCRTRLQANQSFLLLLFSSFIVGSGFLDVGQIDQYYPLNLGRIMMFDTAFKGVPLMTFSSEIIRILAFTFVMILLAWTVLAKRATLA